MLNWLLRYQPAIDILDEFRAAEVLDVGAGWHGLSRWRSGSTVQTDLLLGDRPRRLRHRGRPSYVRASAEALPFKDDAFDFVVSLDMVEHLPESIRIPSILELLRVARRGVIIGYPSGQNALDVDQHIAETCSQSGRALPSWLAEHLEQASYPGRDTIDAALPAGWTITREISNGNVRVQRALVLAELKPALAVLSSLLDRPVGRMHWLPRGVHARPTYRTIWLLEPAYAQSRRQASP